MHVLTVYQNDNILSPFVISTLWASMGFNFLCNFLQRTQNSITHTAENGDHKDDNDDVDYGCGVDRSGDLKK